MAYAFTHGKIKVPEIDNAEKTLHIDSRVLDEAESQDEPVAVSEAPAIESDDADAEGGVATKKLTKKELAEKLRQQVDTVGQIGKPGEQIQNVISVGMLSEGWDAKTVTHIMGLRAFSSQLLCEQVVGRGLRRTSYEISKTEEGERFEAEYVNIFGVPFTFLPHEGGEGSPPPPPKPKTEIKIVPERAAKYEISWPNVVRIDHVFRPKLTLDMAQVPPLELDVSRTPTLANLAPVVEGKPDATRIKDIDLIELAKGYRTQATIFEVAHALYDEISKTWKGAKDYLLAQLIGLVEKFIRSERITITPRLFETDELRRRLVITLNLKKVIEHIGKQIKFHNTAALIPIFDTEKPIRSTGDMLPWFSGRPCEPTKRSHVNFCVYDSSWEASESFILDKHEAVAAWVKNDHIGFEIMYVFEGVIHKFRPDFLVRLANGKMLVLEIKGQDSRQNIAKREFLDEWVRAVNEHGGFGRWCWDVSRIPADVRDILNRWFAV